MSIPILKYRQWAKIFTKGGATYHGRDGQGHHAWSYTPKGEDSPIMAGIAAHDDGSDVLPVYPRQARKAWKLTTKDGVSDHDFMKSNWPKDPPEA
ncbi:MAG: hypothetical protein K8I27_12905 [Planctomycetes bacterium]|nr:hypothetical protein [Planctomycetota bacterium]